MSKPTLTTYLGDTDEVEGIVEIHKCNACGGLLGIDATFTEQVTDQIDCPMCENEILLEDPTDIQI